MDEIAAGSRNPLLLLSAAARQLNPRQFDLPKDINCPVNFPGDYSSSVTIYYLPRSVLFFVVIFSLHPRHLTAPVNNHLTCLCVPLKY